MEHKSPAANITEANSLTIELLITDAKLALTLMDLAATTNVAADRSRRLGEAQQAYRTILSFVPRVMPTQEQAETLQDLMKTLRTRLRAAGVAIE